MKTKKLKRRIAELENELDELRWQLVSKSLSKKFSENYHDNSELLFHSDSEIKIWFYNVLNDTLPRYISDVYPPPKLRQYTNCLEYIAEIYEIEPADVQLILNFKE